MRLLAAAAIRPSALHRLLSTTTETTATASCYDPTAQFLPSGHHHRGLSLPASLRRDALLALVRLLKTSPQCHLSLRVLRPCSRNYSSPNGPLAARFTAAFRLTASAPALRPFAAIVLAALLPSASSDMLSWASIAGGSASARYSALRRALHAFLAAGMAAEALEVLAGVRSSGNTPSLSALATLLRLLFRSGEVQAAWKVLEEMTARGPRPSLTIFNAMILGFCHKGMVHVGYGLFGVMGRFHVVPDAYSFNILIKGHCVFGRSKDAFKLFDEMRRSGVEPTAMTYNILVDILCHERRMEEARMLFDEMVQVGIEANTVTFNVLIDGYAKTGRIDEANATFEDMKLRGLVPDCWTYNILTAGVYKFGRPIKIAHNLTAKKRLAHNLRLLHEAFHSQVSADELDMLVCRLCWDGRLDDAWGLVPDCWTYNILTAGVYKFGRPIKLAHNLTAKKKLAHNLRSLHEAFHSQVSADELYMLVCRLCWDGRLDDAWELLLGAIEWSSQSECCWI